VTALATLYLASAVAAETREYLPDFRQLDARIGSRNAGRLVTLLQTLPRGTTIPDELKEGTYVFFAFYQLSLPNLTIHYFDPDAAPPSDTYALVRASWPGSTYGYSNVGCETMTNTCLWTSSLEAARSLTTILRSTDPWSGGIRLSQISGIDFGSLDQPWATTRGVLFPEVADGLTWRWTDGDAEYRLDAILSGRPSELSVSLFLPVPEKIRITVGAVQLFSRALPTGLFKQTFPLRQRNFTRATTIGIASVPVSANVPKPFDTLGVQVRSLRIR
jgi:hypothetical protein